MKKFFNILLTCAIAAFTFCSCKEDNIKSTEKPESDPINTYFPGEVQPQNSVPCFQGAYYRKVVSSKDFWLGLGGQVVLPVIKFDLDRVNPAKPKQYLDNPSIYLGGNSNGQETDIGLTWEVIKDVNGNVSQDRLAFRPFMRRTAYKSTGQSSNYSNAPAEASYYWYPGDTVNISVKLIRNGILLFIVEGEGKKYETEYACDGYLIGSRAEYKRVNAIDQVANEGKPAQPTKTKVEHSIWIESYLFRIYNNQIVKAPIHKGRFTDMRCPHVMFFNITATEDNLKSGAEQITIDGGISF